MTTLRSRTERLLDRLKDLFADDPPEEPFYDPVHLGTVLVGTLTAFGCLYWLLWTLLVYEGGVFMKASAFLRVLFTSKTLRDFGYEGPWARGVFEGWPGTLGALAVALVLLGALHSFARKNLRD